MPKLTQKANFIKLKIIAILEEANEQTEEYQEGKRRHGGN